MSTVSQLQKKSEKSLGILSKTIKSLQEVNKEIIFAKAKRIEVIDKAQGEVSQLEVEQKRNEKIIDKMNSFLEV